MKRIDRDTLNGILITILFYIVIVGIVIVSIFYQAFKFQTLSFIILLILVFVAESFEQAILSIVKSKRIIQIFIVIKEFLTSFWITLTSLIIVVQFLTLTIGDKLITKNIFNIIVSATFFTALFLYWMYSSINVSEKLDKLSIKLLKGQTFSSTVIKESLNKNEIINTIDLIAIFTTVFLLGNSTISSVVNIDEKPKDFFDSIEYKLLFIVMAIYVQAAYYKLPINHK